MAMAALRLPPQKLNKGMLAPFIVKVSERSIASCSNFAGNV